MGKPLYRIKDWQENFETAETRKLKVLRWVPTPNRHDGLGFKAMMAEPDALQLFSCWVLILQIASRNKPEERGNLARDGKPLDARQLALMTGIPGESAGEAGGSAGTPADLFERALQFFSSDASGWLEVIYESSPGTPAESPGTPAESPAEGKEWNGKNGMEEKENPQTPKGAGVCKNLTQKQKGRMKHEREPTNLMQRLAAIFSRRPDTKWYISEVEAFDEISPTEEEVALLEKFYAYKNEQLKKGATNHWRSSLSILLNNWQDALDKANGFVPQKTKQEQDPDLNRNLGTYNEHADFDPDAGVKKI